MGDKCCYMLINQVKKTNKQETSTKSKKLLILTIKQTKTKNIKKSTKEEEIIII